MILVTGATGLVGGHLLWHLLQNNETIVATKRKNSDLVPLRKIFSFYTKDPESYLKKIQWRIADINNLASLNEAMLDIRFVYHCAAIVSLSNSTDDIISTNVNGTANIVQAALNANVQHFCYVSSIAACGQAEGNTLIDENTQISNIENKSAYAQSKYYAEQEVWKGIKRGLHASIVNPGVILGFSGTNRGSSELFSTVRKGLPFYTLGGSGYVDVVDVVQIMIYLTTNNITGQRFILVGENCSNYDIISWIAKGYSKPKPFICIGKKTLLFVASLSELLHKTLGIKLKFDKNMARSASNRSWYSNKKVTELNAYQFNKIETCINNVCKFETQTF